MQQTRKERTLRERMKIEWKKEREYEGMNKTKMTKDGAIKRGGTWRVCVAGQDTAWGEHQNDAERGPHRRRARQGRRALLASEALLQGQEADVGTRTRGRLEEQQGEDADDSESGRYAQIAFGGGRRHAGG